MNLNTFLDKLAFENIVEKLLILAVIFFLSLNIYTNLTTKVMDINNEINFVHGGAMIFFTKPVSRLIASIHTSPAAELKIDWEKPIFRDTLYRVMSLENTKALLPGQEYLVSIKDIRTADRLRRIPINFVLKTSPMPKDPPSNLFTKHQEKGETYVYMKDYPDYKILIEKE